MSRELKSVLIVANQKKPKIEHTVQLLIHELNARNISYKSIEPQHFRLDDRSLLTDIDTQFKYRPYDLIIAVGGDGTFLYTARNFFEMDLPILGINAGRLGFLMEVKPSEISDAFNKITRDEMTINRRLMLEANVYRDNRLVYCCPYLNDAVISKGLLSRMVELTMHLDSELLSQYRSDGIIISTPTGSTAYNLAAGGPILSQEMEAMIITPICPHTLGVRPIVTSCDKELKILVKKGESDAALTIDGQESFALKPEDCIIIKKCVKYISLYDYGEKQFFTVLREKLGWQS